MQLKNLFESESTIFLFFCQKETVRKLTVDELAIFPRLTSSVSEILTNATIFPITCKCNKA